MKPSAILGNIPDSLRVDIGENRYTYAVQSIELETLTLSANGDPLREICFDEAPKDFKQHLAQLASERATLAIIEKQLGRKLEASHVGDNLKAWQYIHTGDNAFLKFCAGVVFEYHALDRELTQTLLLGMTRASYSSVSALAHFDCTGASGAGKNDLVNRVVALVPPHYLDLFSTISPTALQYETLIKETDEKGRSRVRVNKERFKNKIICITELADTTGYAALKALAETDEDAEFTHMATVNGESVKMTITGPRCVITTSVEGVNDSQVKRRFIHTSVSDDSFENQQEKLELVEELLIEEKNIRDDPRLKIAQAGIDLIFSAQGAVFEQIDSEAEKLLKYLDVLFLKSGYGITNIKQFFTLCQCSALWKRFARGYCQIEVGDVIEAWFLLATFERETITKTTKHGIAVLETIKELCDDYDRAFELDQEGSGPKELYEPKRPTRTDIVKASDVPQATVYRLLKPTQNAEGKLGELLELGYMVNQHRTEQTVFELTDLGRTVLSDVPRKATVNNERYEPVEPLEVGDTNIGPLISLEAILERRNAYADEKDDA